MSEKIVNYIEYFSSESQIYFQSCISSIQFDSFCALSVQFLSKISISKPILNEHEGNINLLILKSI